MNRDRGGVVRKPVNTVFICSDQHNAAVTGCYGNGVVRTPNLDSLARRGTRFTAAYTNSPLCCPARAVMATGRYVHENTVWDNAHPYDGSIVSWAHRIREAGHRIDAIGKMHFRCEADDNGFTEEHNTMHVVAGDGDVAGCLRQDPGIFDKRMGVLNAGPGTSSYITYDAENADAACRWIRDRVHEGEQAQAEPWFLYLGLALPHPPNKVPGEYFDMYADTELPMPPQWRCEEWPRHPAIEFAREYFNFTEQISESEVRRFLAAYYGAVTYLDRQIGKVLDALEHAGISEDTLVVYTSDHGEDLGARGLFGKFHFYDEAARIPLICAGPGFPAGCAVATPVSLADLYPTFLQASGIQASVSEPTTAEPELPGSSLFALANEEDAERTVFGEYHGVGTRNGTYMLRDGTFKYIYYVDGAPMLFDMKADPDELHDLAGDPAYREVLGRFEASLREIVDPERVDAEAKAAQAARIEAAGGAEAVRSRGTFDNSPIPGEKAEFFTRE